MGMEDRGRLVDARSLCPADPRMGRCRATRPMRLERADTGSRAGARNGIPARPPDCRKADALCAAPRGLASRRDVAPTPRGTHGSLARILAMRAGRAFRDRNPRIKPDRARRRLTGHSRYAPADRQTRFCAALHRKPAPEPARIGRAIRPIVGAFQTGVTSGFAAGGAVAPFHLEARHQCKFQIFALKAYTVKIQHKTAWRR